MILHDELLLMAVVTGLYLYDSALLLYANEGILTLARNGKWSVAFGSRRYQILGKEVFVPNPFLPHRPLFRLAWSFEGKASKGDERWLDRVSAITPLMPLVLCMTVALFVLLPLGFFARLGDSTLLAAIALLYSSIITALVWIWVKRSVFRLSGKRFASLAFEVLVCSPFALNLVRKLSLDTPVGEDFVQAAGRLLDPQKWDATRDVLASRLDDAIESEDEKSDRVRAMVEHRGKLTDRLEPCPSPKSS